MKRAIHYRTIGLAFVFACLVIALTAVATQWFNYRLVRSYDSLAASHQSYEKLQTIRTLVESAEASVYGYLITLQKNRLKPYRQAMTLLPKRLKELERLVRQHPGQKKALAELKPLLTLHQQYLAQMVAVRERHGFQAAVGWVKDEDEHAVQDGLDHLLGEIQKEEARILKARATSTTEHSTESTIALFVATALLLLLIVFVFELLRRELGKRLAAEDTSDRLEKFLRTVVDRIPYMVLVKEAATLRITLANQAAAEWLGMTEEELLGSNDYDLRPKDAARVATRQDREVLNSGVALDIPEEPLIRAGKEERLLHTQKVAIPDEDGRPAYLLTISEDITRRKQAERMLELSRDAAVQSERLKGEFIRNMSHEIRTPLSVVVGMTTMLMDTALTPEQMAIAKRVANAASGLTRLSKGILDFSKIEAGTFTLQMDEMNIRQDIESILAMVQEQANTKGITLTFLMAPSVPEVVVGDSPHLRQVITEFVNNALKFSARGHITVSVREEGTTLEDLWMRVEVADQGPGMDEALQKELFIPFRQGDGSATRKFGGTGLGLAVSKRMIELMGGTIGCSSVAGKGSTFWVKVPFKRKGTAPHEVTVSRTPRARVLVVHDDPITRQMLMDRLRSWAMGCEGAENGEEALGYLHIALKEGHPFQMVLLDDHLIDMEARDFLQTLRAETSFSGVRCILLSEPSAESATLTDAGFDALLAKPLDPDKLYEKIAALISAHRHSSAA